MTGSETGQNARRHASFERGGDLPAEGKWLGLGGERAGRGLKLAPRAHDKAISKIFVARGKACSASEASASPPMRRQSRDPGAVLRSAGGPMTHAALPGCFSRASPLPPSPSPSISTRACRSALSTTTIHPPSWPPPRPSLRRVPAPSPPWLRSPAPSRPRLRRRRPRPPRAHLLRCPRRLLLRPPRRPLPPPPRPPRPCRTPTALSPSSRPCSRPSTSASSRSSSRA